jgi:serine/threonine-protein kinase
LEKLCTEPAPRLPDHARWGLPPNLEYLIGRLLEKDPAARPRDADEVLAFLGAAQPVPVATPQNPPMPQPSSSASMPAHDRGSVSYDTIAIIDGGARHARRQGSPRWFAPLIAVAGLILTAAVFGWIFLGPLLGPPESEAPSEAEPASVAGSSKPATTPAQAPTPACEGPAQQWRGAWEIRTLSTEAIKPSWIGGRSFYDLTLDVDGCQITGSGRKLLDDKVRWTFNVDGTATGDGSVSLHYQVDGRNIEGTWTIAQNGSGTWASANGDSSGTLTVTRPGTR